MTQNGDMDRIDLRRTRDTTGHREVTAWSEHLAPEDNALMQAIFLHNMKLHLLAASRRECPDTLRKHVRRLLQRISGDEFRFVARNLQSLPPPTRAIAQLCVLHGRSIREASRALRLNPEFVRQQRRLVLPLLNSILKPEGDTQ